MPEMRLLLQYLQHDYRIACSTNRAVLNGIGQFRQARRVVPQARRCRLSHLIQGALVRRGRVRFGENTHCFSLFNSDTGCASSAQRNNKRMAGDTSINKADPTGTRTPRATPPWLAPNPMAAGRSIAPRLPPRVAQLIAASATERQYDPRTPKPQR